MILQQLNRSDAEKVFIIGKNTAAATISAGAPVYFETDSVTDGNSVSAAKGLLAATALFAGINHASLTQSSYGLIQVYGFRTSAYVSAASAGCAIGIPLLPVVSQTYLTDTVSSNDFRMVNLMQTIGAAAGASAVLQYKVFIRAL